MANGYSVPLSRYFDRPFNSNVSVSDRNGRLIIRATPKSSVTIGGIFTAAPAPAPPYTVDICASMIWTPDLSATGCGIGICLYNNANLRVFNNTSAQFGAPNHQTTSIYEIDTFSLDGSFVAQLQRACITVPLYKYYGRLTDDGVNKQFWISGNGLDYVNVYTESANAFGVVSRLGIVAGASNDATQPAALGYVYSFSVRPGILGDAP